MRRAVIGLVLLFGCGDGAPDRGTPLPTCIDCGPGAVLGGRLFPPSAGVWMSAANRKGTVALGMGFKVVVFDDDLVMKDWITVDDDSLMGLGIDDADGLVVADAHLVERSGPEEMETRLYSGDVTRYTTELEARWSHPFERVYGVNLYASASSVTVFGQAEEVHLRASDGSVVWQRPLPSGHMAGSPDGTLFIAGESASTRTGFVASIDPSTGEATWTQKLDPSGVGMQAVHDVAAGPANEVAVAWDRDWPNGDFWLTLFDADGNVRWSQPAPVQSLQTDGEHIIGIDTFGIVQYSATGLDWRTDPRCQLESTTLTPGRELLALTEDHIVALIDCDAYEASEVTVTIGDVSYTGDGKAIVKLAR